MPITARISGPFDQVLTDSSIEWAINSKTNEFQPMNVIFQKHDAMAPRKGYHVTIQLREKPKPSSSTEPSSLKESTQQSMSESAKGSESSTAPSLKLSETTFARSELSEIASMWSDESFETSLTIPSDTNSNDKAPDEPVSDKDLTQIPGEDVPEKAAGPNEGTKTLDKGKGKARDDGDDAPAVDGPVDPRTLQPHYRSLLDDFDDFYSSGPPQ